MFLLVNKTKWAHPPRQCVNTTTSPLSICWQFRDDFYTELGISKSLPAFFNSLVNSTYIRFIIIFIWMHKKQNLLTSILMLIFIHTITSLISRFFDFKAGPYCRSLLFLFSIYYFFGQVTGQQTRLWFNFLLELSITNVRLKVIKPQFDLHIVSLYSKKQQKFRPWP